MTRSPAGRRAPRSSGAGPDEWLEVPGWRRPVDTLLVLAVTFATAWVGLVVIPAAANSDSGVTDKVTPTENDASPPTADPTQDPGQWFAGPVYTGGPAAPTTAQVADGATVVVAAPRTPAHRATPRKATTDPAPRTTAKPPAPTTTVAAAAAAATTPVLTTTAETTPPVTTTPETTTPETTTPETTTPETTTTSSSTTTETTTTTPSTSTSEPAPPPPPVN